jgi:hypothetical protein
MKSLFERNVALGDYRVAVKAKEPAYYTYELAEAEARNQCRKLPGAQIEIMQVVGVFKGAVEVIKLEKLDAN